jgi:hypothetical protein
MKTTDLPNITVDATARIHIYPSGWKSISDSDTRCIELWLQVDNAIGFLECE